MLSVRLRLAALLHNAAPTMTLFDRKETSFLRPSLWLWERFQVVTEMCRAGSIPARSAGGFMTERDFLEFCFRWWSTYCHFTVDNERSAVDISGRIPSDGWKT